jgi:hypothetical protein
MIRLTPQLETNIKETLEDFRCLIPRFSEVKNNPELLRKFCSRNRNPLFDVTSNNQFKTGLGTKRALKTVKPVEDHFIQRTKAVRIIFEKLEDNPDMEFEEFVSILKKYCSTVSLTKDEHTEVTKISKQESDMLNWEIYQKCGIVVEGIDDLVWDIASEGIDEQERLIFEQNYENYKLNYANLSTIS